jgi:thiol:disulfide interchange protein DsbD
MLNNFSSELKKEFLVIVLILCSSFSLSQTTSEYVKISAQADKSAYRPGDTIKLALIAEIIKPYHINSYKVSDPTLIPTSVKGLNENIITEGVSYPADKKLKFEFTESEINVYEGKIVIGLLAKASQNIAEGPVYFKYSFDFQACDDKVCYSPKSIKDSIQVVITKTGNDIVAANSELFDNLNFSESSQNFVKSEKVQITKLTENERTSEKINSGEESSDWIAGKGMFSALIIIFLGGLALNLTPCVYPLIPITLSFFGAQASGSKTQSILMGVFYALGMAVTYSTLGVIAALTGGILGTALQNPIVIIGIALIMGALGLSMFGLFEIRVPQKLALMGNTNRSGYLGSLLMGLTVGFIAAPCIGPFVLSLLVYVGKIGDPFTGFLLFFVLAMGLGLPYIFLAAYSSSISKLPRSGEWMIGVKVIFGLVLFGMTLNTLEPLIPKNVFAIIFPLYIILSGVYLLLIDKQGKNSAGYTTVKQIIAIAAVVAGTWLLKPHSETSEVKWTMMNSLESVTQSVKSEGKPVMIDFYADWCAQCKELDKYTYTDPEIVEMTKSFNNIKIDLTKENEAITSGFDIKGLPVVVFMGPDGKEFKELRVTGFLEPEEFKKRIESLEKNISAK